MQSTPTLLLIVSGTYLGLTAPWRRRVHKDPPSLPPIWGGGHVPVIIRITTIQRVCPLKNQNFMNSTDIRPPFTETIPLVENN